jgi:hypothetical protein
MTHPMLDAELVEKAAETGAYQPQRAHTGPLLVAGEDADHPRGAECAVLIAPPPEAAS